MELHPATLWEAISDAVPDRLAIAQGTIRHTWRDFDERAARLAGVFAAHGLGAGARVGQLLFNCPEYLESLYGAWKAGLVPVNTNYRYTDDELAYLWDNADAVAVVFHGAFVETVERVRERVPGVRLWLWVDDGTSPCPAWAIRASRRP